MTTKLQEFIIPEAITLGMNAASAEEVIRHLSDKLLNAGYVRESFADAVLAREKTIPTGLPLNGLYNVAIPHTDIEHVLKPGIGMATLTEPVVFHNMVSPEETVDVQLVFILALDKPKSQIEMLQEIAGVLQNPEMVAGLINAHDPDQVHEALRKAEK
jgi:PTS system galactitol-specific IIA component